MHRLRSILVCFLAVIWLPATLHCALDRAGLLADSPACCGGDDEQAPAAADHCGNGCQFVADRTAPGTSGVIRIVAPGTLPDAAAWATIAVPAEAAARLGGHSPPARPAAWTRTWQFVFRAASTPRAPALVH